MLKKLDVPSWPTYLPTMSLFRPKLPYLPTQKWDVINGHSVRDMKFNYIRIWFCFEKVNLNSIYNITEFYFLKKRGLNVCELLSFVRNWGQKSRYKRKESFQRFFLSQVVHTKKPWGQFTRQTILHTIYMVEPHSLQNKDKEN